VKNPCKDIVEERTVYRILDKEANSYVGVYSRACHDEFDFDSEKEARSANCHGTYQDTDRYDVVKMKRYYVNEQH
jgi:hypothetical protein